MTLSQKLITSSLMILLAVSATVLLSGCGGGEELGTGIPKDQPVVSLAEVLESPAKYHEKMIVIKGTVSSQCSALCDFSITDGANSVNIFQQDFKFPKLAFGEPVTVYVQTTVGERLILSALGMKLK
ncbi:hypothetical protein K8T06_15420 [bacterium]|nr:hypothetical protein [bacterium]